MKKNNKIYFESLNTCIGELWIGFTTKGLTKVLFSKNRDSFINELNNEYNDVVEFNNGVSEYSKQLILYFEKKLKCFDIPLDLKGTSFQLEVWQQLLKIPYGEVKSYKDIAEAIGKSKAYRTVGMANNRNPISIVVPCHRVIGSNGELVGYGGGIENKVKLLKLEGLDIIEKERNGKKLYYISNT